MVNLIEEYVGEYLVACSFIMWMMATRCLLPVYMVLLWTVIVVLLVAVLAVEDSFGKRLLVYAVGDMYRGVLGGILISLISRVRGRGILVLVPLWLIFLTLIFNWTC